MARCINHLRTRTSIKSIESRKYRFPRQVSRFKSYHCPYSIQHEILALPAKQSVQPPVPERGLPGAGMPRSKFIPVAWAQSSNGGLELSLEQAAWDSKSGRGGLPRRAMTASMTSYRSCNRSYNRSYNRSNNRSNNRYGSPRAACCPR